MKYSELLLRVRVLSIHKYDSYEDMLKVEGLKNCLPTATSVTEGCNIYRSFPGAYQERKRGVLAFRITTNLEETMSHCLNFTPPRNSQHYVAFKTPSKRQRHSDVVLSPSSKLRKRLEFSPSTQQNTCVSPISRVPTLSVSSRCNIPPRMPNPYKRKHATITNMCYINATLQLLASSNFCTQQCLKIEGPVSGILLSIRNGSCPQTKMGQLLAHGVFRGDKKLFTLGMENCAIEFMNWCVEQLKLNHNTSAITQTLVKQTCLSCKRTWFTSRTVGGPRGLGNGTCILSATGNITDHGIIHDRVQRCRYPTDCPNTIVSVNNMVQCQEIYIHGEVAIYRWAHRSGPICLQKNIDLTAKASSDCIQWERCKYRLCGFTVFHGVTKHYTTYRYISSQQYHCNDNDISVSCHSLKFANTKNEDCVMAIYEKIPVLSNCLRYERIRSASCDRRWTAVHGDGFCWIYAFLVSTGLLTGEDFPYGNDAVGPPSCTATELANAIASYAFSDETTFTKPTYGHKNISTMGTFGGAPHFMNLLERIRPACRFFILDETHTYIRRAFIVKDGYTDDEVTHTQPDFIPTVHGVNLRSLCERRGGGSQYLLEYDRQYYVDMPQLKWARSPNNGMRNDEYVLLRDTDAVVCWQSRVHFNALSRPEPDLTVKLFVNTIINCPEQVDDLFPPPTRTLYNSSDSDVECC